jgi:hypothetical protein
VSPGNGYIDRLIQKLREERERRRVEAMSPLDRIAEVLDEAEPPPVTVQVDPYKGRPPGTMRRPGLPGKGVLEALWKRLKPSVG